jgi:hypothetical protein
MTLKEASHLKTISHLGKPLVKPILPKGGREIISDFVWKNKLSLKKLYTFVSHFLKRVGPNRQAKKRGRPPKYGGTLILTLWQEKQPLPAHCF